ncbi:MAG: sortase, partial [bacterium]|nr:sortase [bacterium]
MTKYGYAKSKSPEKIIITVSPKKVAVSFSALFTFAGIIMIGTVLLPFLQWQFIYLPTQPKDKFASPVPKFATPVSANYSSEFTDDWMPKSSSASAKNQRYSISIPKLKITNAVVEFGATDLKKSLIGWGDSSSPGAMGNNIIFGHSALPTFYNPKDYHTIFSLLPTLKIGDEIYIDFDGISYKFAVFEMQTVDPDDFSVLEQRFDDSYLTLVTCVPPGTYWKRLVVRARVTKF